MKTLVLFVFTLLPVSLLAQVNETPAPARQYDFKRITQTVDLSLATVGDFTTAAVSVNRLHGLGRARRFRIGYGLRLTSAFGTNANYRTAPANLTSGNVSIVALFSEDIVANIDTVRFPKSQVNSLNVSINLEYGLTRRFDVGINIDAIGFSVGARQTGTFIANSPFRSSLSGTQQEARVTPFNLLLISDSDIGSLNSEAYVRYRVSPRVSLRGGINFQFNEYTTNRKLTFENDRFRSKNALPMLAVSYHF
ncbi:MAG: hypothetical protein H7Z72_00465 [Bacteroidetes bacterium]|nr:hypothetical protein [Fibrella sp.]